MVEIISVHIPKTAGVSFHALLGHIYGTVTSAYDYLDDPEMRPEYDFLLYSNYPERKRLWDIAMARVGPDVRVLADHTPVQLYDGLFPEVRRVVWLRDPVARVISNFIHAKYAEPRGRIWLLQADNIRNFITQEYNRNVMSFFTADGDLDRFFFVGIVEHFEQDVSRLASALGWPNDYPVIYRNKTKDSALKAALLADKDVIAEIERLNQQDIELYRQIIERRA